jgi:hypothetical protein
LRELEAFTVAQQLSDVHYAAVAAEILKRIDDTVGAAR